MMKYISAMAFVLVFGCVERTITFTSQPKGALVYLNDKEIGRTPVSVPFEWYGDYDIILRKDGCEPLKTHCKIKPPWYQYIPIDFFAGVLWPGTIRDDRILDYELMTMKPTNQTELSQRAIEMRHEAMSYGITDTQPADNESAGLPDENEEIRK
jgi:hypothetical protein